MKIGIVGLVVALAAIGLATVELVQNRDLEWRVTALEVDNSRFARLGSDVDRLDTEVGRVKDLPRGCLGRNRGRSSGHVAVPDNGEPRRGGAFPCKEAISPAEGEGFEPSKGLHP